MDTKLHYNLKWQDVTPNKNSKHLNFSRQHMNSLRLQRQNLISLFRTGLFCTNVHKPPKKNRGDGREKRVNM